MTFTPEQEAELTQVASHHGTNAEELVREAALRLLQDEMRFREGVTRGIAAADRGEYVDSAHVWSRVEAALGS